MADPLDSGSKFPANHANTKRISKIDIGSLNGHKVETLKPQSNTSQGSKTFNTALKVVSAAGFVLAILTIVVLTHGAALPALAAHPFTAAILGMISIPMLLTGVVPLGDYLGRLNTQANISSEDLQNPTARETEKTNPRSKANVTPSLNPETRNQIIEITKQEIIKLTNEIKNTTDPNELKSLQLKLEKCEQALKILTPGAGTPHEAYPGTGAVGTGPMNAKPKVAANYKSPAWLEGKSINTNEARNIAGDATSKGNSSTAGQLSNDQLEKAWKSIKPLVQKVFLLGRQALNSMDEVLLIAQTTIDDPENDLNALNQANEALRLFQTKIPPDMDIALEAEITAVNQSNDPQTADRIAALDAIKQGRVPNLEGQGYCEAFTPLSEELKNALKPS